MRVQLLLTLIVLGLISCTSKQIKEEVKTEVSKTPAITTEKELHNIEDEILKNNKNLSEEQKNKLFSLIKETRNSNQATQDQIIKLRAVLFKELLSDNPTSRAKIRIIERQLYKLDKKKTRNSLNAFKEAKVITGKDDKQLEQTLMYISRKTSQEF